MIENTFAVCAFHVALFQHCPYLSGRVELWVDTYTACSAAAVGVWDIRLIYLPMRRISERPSYVTTDFPPKLATPQSGNPPRGGSANVWSAAPFTLHYVKRGSNRIPTLPFTNATCRRCNTSSSPIFTTFRMWTRMPTLSSLKTKPAARDFSRYQGRDSGSHASTSFPYPQRSGSSGVQQCSAFSPSPGKCWTVGR